MSLFLYIVVGGVLLAAPFGTALHAALQPASRWATADLAPGAWVVVALLVPFGWVLYLASARPRLSEARERLEAARVLGATSTGRAPARPTG